MALNPGLADCHNKNQTQEIGAGEKDGALFRCRLSEKMGLYSSPGAHLNISVQAGTL